MQAIILAAGMGKRLKELTKENTKCQVKINGVTLIERMLHQIDSRGFSRIIIVCGYMGQKLKDYVNSLNIKTPVIFIDNPEYEKTNNIYSLALTKDYLCQEDTILFDSDIIFEDQILDELLKDERDTLAIVAKYESWMDGLRVELSEEGEIARFVPENEFKFSEPNHYYKTINIFKLGKDFLNTYYIPFMEAYLKATGFNSTYEQILKIISYIDEPKIEVKKLTSHLWYEINDMQDVDMASILFNPNEEERLAKLQSTFGGYWRFPEMLDFNFLVNPYFPPKKLLNEIKANFDTIITQYPSGLRVNSLLAAKCFGVHLDNIVVGNGTSEYIKNYMESVSGRTGFISPTFEEYPNRYDKNESVVFIPDNRDFCYDENDIINFFDDKDIRTLIVVNPDNPSGNLISLNGILKLLKWGEEKNINIVIDESFVDFSEEEDPSLIKQEILDENPNLVVLKSISKSYGVPGLRLGVLASGDKQLIARMKKTAAIWNINSVAEFYMQMEGKYHQDYLKSLHKIRKERRRFYEGLCQLPHMHVIPSQANYIMIELLDGISSSKLTNDLLAKHNILIKDLFKKTGGKNYIRIAVRNTEDNNALLKALKTELN